MSGRLGKTTAQAAWGHSEVRAHLTSTEGPGNLDEEFPITLQPGKSEGKSQSKGSWERKEERQGRRLEKEC